MNYPCGRINTKKGKTEWCNKPAKYISPPGIHTGRIINVCTEHMKDLKNVFTQHRKVVTFQRL